MEFHHFKNLKRHGVYRIYSREIPGWLIEEKHFTDGIIDGRCREWDEKGNLVKDDTFELGFLPPVFRYTGKESSGITLHRSGQGVTYARAPNAPEVSEIKVGMTMEEVSNLLKIDFSPSQGLMFWHYQIDEYLHIKFKDNKVSELRTGPNGVHPGFNRER